MSPMKAQEKSEKQNKQWIKKLSEDIIPRYSCLIVE